MTKDATKPTTTITRRALLQSAAWSAVAAVNPAGAEAPYPARPVTWVIPFAPGGATGRLSLLICDRLTRRLGQPFILDHRPGAGGSVATRSVANAAPDGYTILATSTANIINASAGAADADGSGDLVPVAGMARMPLLLLVNKELSVKTLPEFLAYARANPGKLSVGSAGPGTVQLLSAELFRTLGGISWSVVHYRGSGPALTDLASGHIHAMFDNTASATDLLRSGKIRALAVSTRERAEAFPNLPPVADVLPAFETSGFYGVAAPRATPQAVVDLLNREINAALADPAIAREFAEIGATPITGDSQVYASTYRAEVMRWRKLVATQASAKN
ncbi:MFS transporter [Bradyrhizobium sp. SSBR45G]|uniref:Bug family tripartite tricarboxylate transporter substrate binding protein n=1 Tax=unclassified Bradyrhizobium TaxID=2631580 RepID=UPI002342A4CF|nr:MULTISPECIES: tripartite tricarboxylate transporter substrate binding protein [unclassified Bradyrhizobium]GLH80122.1 MFS transporter [Bradyrhizobium sp. SSBR45G]GLH87569.1 MFS transporter [Bradyrhizobium sp. SSBR45R]